MYAAIFDKIYRIIEVSENIPYYLQAIAGLAFRRIESLRDMFVRCRPLTL